MATKTVGPQLEYVNNEYKQKLERFASDRDIPMDTAEQEFLHYCERMEGTLKDDTPIGVTRRLAFHQLEWNA